MNRSSLMSVLFLKFSFILLVNVGMAQNNFSPFEKDIFILAEDTLPYRLLKPNSADSTVYPLVIFFHGSGERGNNNNAQLKHIAPLFLNEANRTQYPCFVLAPQCKKGSYWGGVARPLFTLIDEIIAKYPIDKKRIYITGVSMGGYGTWWLLGKFPNRFAAAIPVCGGGDARWAKSFAQTPVWAFHGSKDNTVTPDKSRTMIEAMKKAGGSPKYTEYPEVGHQSWINAYREPEILSWLFSQKLP